MKFKILIYLLISLNILRLTAQENSSPEAKIEMLKDQKGLMEIAERNALKEKVKIINEKLKNKEISNEVADSLKHSVAKFHALNIENRLNIVNNNIELVKRNNGLFRYSNNKRRFDFGLGQINEKGERIFGILYTSKNKKKFHSGRRLTSDFVFGYGYSWSTWNHGAASIFDKVLPSYNANYYELGWSWKYRINKDNNRFRLNFGLSYQRDKVEGDFYEGEKIDTGIRWFRNPDFEFNPDDPDNVDDHLNSENTTGVVLKSATKIEKLIIPIYFEVGPSKIINAGSDVRYSIKNRFRYGLGFYTGINLGVWHKTSNSVTTSSGSYLGEDKTSETLSYNKFLFGLGTYMGKGGILVHIKYDVSTIYQIGTRKHRNLTLGLRFDL